jgi:hypothetical protein
MPCKRRICPSYAALWAYDWRIVLLENLIAYAGKAVLYTLTPPGAEVQPWDRSRCSHPTAVPCSVRAWVRDQGVTAPALERDLPEASVAALRDGAGGG